MPTACNIYCQKTRKGNQRGEKEERIALGSAALNLKRAAGALPRCAAALHGSSTAYICTCTQQLPPPCRGGAGGEALPMYVYVTYLFCLNMSKITFA